MRPVLANILVIFATLLPSFAHAAPYDLDRDSTRSANLEAIAKRMDPRGDAELRPTLKGGFRTTLGAQFARSCMDRINPVSEEQRGFLNDMVIQAASQMIACQKRYPELAPYITQWMSQARRNVIECVDDTKENSQFGGWNDTRGQTTLPYNGLLQVLSGFTLTDDQGREKHYSAGLTTFVHENLHSTEANNRDDHGVVEFIQTLTGTDPKTGHVQPGGCKDDILVDRVNILTSLCTGERIAGSRLIALELLLPRIDGCGMKRGCVDVFTSEEHGNEWPSRGLGLRKAEALCARIYEDGQCMHQLEAQGNTLIGADPEVQAVSRQLFARLNDFVPSRENEIPSSWMKHYPDLKARLDGLAGSACFRSLFLVTPNDTVYQRSGSGNIRSAPLERFHFAISSTLSAHVFYGIEMSLDAPMKESALCASAPEDEKKKITTWLADLGKKLDASQNGTRWEQAVSFALGDYQDGLIYLGPFSGKVKPEFVQLLGEDLFERYVAISKKYNRYSPDFSCESLGLSFHRTVERALDGLLSVNPKRTPNSCPRH